MASSLLRPLTLHLQHRLRSHSKVCVKSVQNLSRIESRALGTTPLLLQEEISNLPTAAQTKSENITSAGSTLFKDLSSLGSVEEVLQAVSQQKLSGNEASIAVSALRHIRRNDEEGAEILGDERFFKLSQCIISGAKNLSNESLISTLINAFYMKSQDDTLILALEGECRRRLRLLPIRFVANIICNDQLFSRRPETKALVTEAGRVLELRWREIQHPQLVRRLLPPAARISEQLLERVEDKALEMLGQFSFQDLTGLTKSLAVSNTRSLPVLRAISYQLLEQRAQWEIAPMVDILSSMGSLGFHNLSLFSEFAAHIQEKIEDCSIPLVCDIAKTYAVLRVQATELLGSVHRMASPAFEDLSTLDLKRLLFAYSQILYQPLNASDFYDKVGDRLVAKQGEMSLRDQIDLAHSLAVLRKVPPLFLEKILQQTEEAVPATQQLKLLQINSYAQLELPDYQGPLLPQDMRAFPQDHRAFKTTLHQSLIKVLQASLGEEFTINENVQTELGYVIDADISTKEESSKKMALVTFGPPCYLYSSKQLIGRLDMMLRHLRAAGFQVLEISYHDWYSLRTPLQQVNYLKEKLTHFLS